MNRFFVFVLTGLLNFTAFGQDELSSNVKYVMAELQLHPDSCNLEFIVEKTLPHAPELVVMVIPEYIWMPDEMEMYYLRGHIVVYHQQTKKIRKHTIEGSESSEWYSDAMQLSEITIDTAPYIIGKDQRAFGVRLLHRGMSRVNPYSSETLTLFLLNGEQLQPILIDLNTKTYTGDTDGNCAGEFREESSVLIMSEKNSNQKFADITVKTKVSYSVYYVDESGECKDASTELSYPSLLRYNEEEGQYNFLRY